VIRAKLKLSLPILVLTSYTSTAYSKCEREDINFYLDKGFSPEQITAICTDSPSQPADVSAITATEKNGTGDLTEPVSNQDTLQKKNEQLLKEAIKGRYVILDNHALQYTLKVCIEYGSEDLYGFAPSACPIIRYTITRKGLEIIKSQKKYIFFGANEIKIKGEISREVISGLEKNSAHEIEIIRTKLETGEHTIIPVRDDIAITEIEQVLLQIAY